MQIGLGAPMGSLVHLLLISLRLRLLLQVLLEILETCCIPESGCTLCKAELEDVLDVYSHKKHPGSPRRLKGTVESVFRTGHFSMQQGHNEVQ